MINPVDLAGRAEMWAHIAGQINQPGLIHNGSIPSKKWTLYNSFFVAVTVASTIGSRCAISISTAKILSENIIKNSHNSLSVDKMLTIAVFKRQTSMSVTSSRRSFPPFK